ncbi:MAG TPA: LpqB family beta-propeller domain-containing protein [Dietzia timorensis]|uniref:Lipoprotein LpqB n=1 Tax=Dietzia timorensis TaxID=499555 RepID=A0A921JY71_9ACTN|nr:LpqB family beta-propeller domain-containing protein [Dietzia timorensis]HJE90889.1 LpqB family beta-propeller domain-containing protein [Dietzia timorensis]
MTAKRSIRLRRRVLPFAAVAVAAITGLTGCVTLPSSSTPRVIDTFAPRASNDDIPTPVPNQEPDMLVRDFIKASALPDQRHAAARQFLTPEANEKWNDAESATVVLRANLSAAGRRTEDRASYTLRAQRVGVLEEGGVFTAGEGEVTAEIELVRVDNQWRIEGLPPGVIMERTEFYTNYSMHNLYFLDPDRDALVPDPRWLSASSIEVAPSLLNMIAGDPRPSLTESVTNRLGPSVSVRPSETGAEGEGTTVDFQGLPTMSSEEIQEFAAQVVWTLNDADIPGPYRLERDGSPIDERRAGGWRVEDVSDFDPDPDTPQLEYVLTSGDGLVRLTGQSAQRFGGEWSEIPDTRYARLSPNGEDLALVAGDGPNAGGAVLKVGPVDGEPADILRGPGITSPTWSNVDDSLWFLGAGGRISRLSNPTDPSSAGEVGQDALDDVDGNVTDMALDPTGVRLFFVADGQAYLSVISYRDRGTPELGPPLRIGQALENTVTSVGWLDRESVLVGRSAVEAPVARITVDGAMTESQSGRNISARIDAVAATGKSIYALDQRSLLQLDTQIEESERYWREVPGLSGIRAFPVVRG